MKTIGENGNGSGEVSATLDLVDYLHDIGKVWVPPNAEGVLGMFTAHFDESSDERKQKVFTIAGYVGHQGEALDLSFKWESLLDKEGLPYFKASECEGGFGPFAKYRDDPTHPRLPLKDHEKARLREVKTKFVSLANKYEQWLGIGVGVVAEDFYQLLTENPASAERLGTEPYFLAYQAILMDAGLMAGYWNKKWNTGHVLAPIFDENEEVSGRAKAMYDEFRISNHSPDILSLPENSSVPSWSHDPPDHPEANEPCALSDILGFCNRRQET